MTRRKQIEFDGETFLALNERAADRMATFQELADEAFRDLLKKHGRPVGLKAALKQSASESKSNVAKLHPSRTARSRGKSARN